MRTRPVLGALLVGLLSAEHVHAKALADMKVLYVGRERADQFVPFLKENVAQVEAADRGGFKAADATDFDVVLLDWPQGGESSDLKKLASPLGARDAWSKPTVLLGSAGLLVAASWETRGGIGCTCMDPLAYDLREHEIFERPYRIGRGGMVSIPTPADFKFEIDAPEITVLALVDDYHKRWKAGWCTYSTGFDRNPDIEFFCGGVNAKTPTAAGLWRQGNLLHFGFEQSPTEMNEEGRHLLLNGIAYISRFSEDRPIAITTSPFTTPTARCRATVLRWLKNPEYPLDFIESLVTPAQWKQLSALPGRAAMLEWADENARYLHPVQDQKLETDGDLVALGVAFDQPAFFENAFADLGSGDTASADRAIRVLKRYAPCGPNSEDKTEWTAWWTENQSFLFASDDGDYRWYIDPLAKDRGVPASELRGPRRADSQ